ncbi:O-antigen ligase family protein [uncultured Maribacter sp.]|uniref:O-antigen ligase family protein n=1 Tax=uncultured Maribacter sp. TaxID=431308 RepID=UPI00261DCA08|nr:O-antigen ligase family protein [uncultured Maribacter sp.]
MKKKAFLDLEGVILFVFIIFNVVLGKYLGEIYQQFATLLLLPVLTILSLQNVFHQSRGSAGSTILMYFVVLVLYALIGVYFLEDYTRFSDEFRKMIYTLMASISAYILVRTKGLENYIHIGFVVSILLLIYIAYINGNYLLEGFASLKGRRNRFLFNANYYSYLSYFANISILCIYVKNKSKVVFILCMILPILFLVLAFVTQSRSGLLFVLLINVTFWFLIDRQKGGQSFKQIFRFILIFGLSIVFILKLIDTYSNSNIANRVSNSAEDSRSVLAKEGMEVFSEYPLTGVGLGQFPLYTPLRQFTHNSYAEVLSEHGIIGGILLILLLFTPFFRSIVLLKKSKDSMLKLLLLFFFTFILYNNFYVFYKFPYAMLYFFMFVALLENESLIVKNKFSENVIEK